MSFLISPAMAADAGAGAAQAPGGQMFQFGFLILFAAIFYFFMWRPQAKRAKAHKNLIASLEAGTEVITAGGIIGKVVRLTDDYVVLEVSNGIEMKFQKSNVAAELPKGTIKSI